MEQKLTEIVEKNQKVVVSDKKQITKEDLMAWFSNFKKYSAPAILVGLLALQAGKSWEEISWLMYGVLLQNAINIVSKWIGESRYVVDKK